MLEINLPRNERPKMKYRPLTRLQRGMVVLFHGEQWRVKLVNESRAHLTPVKARQKVTLKDWAGGVHREFWAQRKGMDISPNSELEVV